MSKLDLRRPSSVAVAASPGGAPALELEGVLARLRKSKRQWQAAEVGRAAAEVWVKYHADFAELRRLDFRWSVYAESYRNWFIDNAKHDYIDERHPMALRLVYEIQPDNNGYPRAADAFWTRLLGDNDRQATHPDFLKGFISGALDLWRKLEPKL